MIIWEMKLFYTFFQKRKSNLNVKASNERPIDIICHNAHKSWSECMEEIQGDIRFNLKTLTYEDFDKTKQFFNWLLMSGNECCYIEELLTRLNKSSEDKNTLYMEENDVIKLRCHEKNDLSYKKC